MIDPVWMKLLGEAPTLGVLVFVVVVFLKHIAASDAARTELIREVGKECHEFQRDLTVKTNEVIVRNSNALDRNSEALGLNSSYFQKHSNGTES